MSTTPPPSSLDEVTENAEAGPRKLGLAFLSTGMGAMELSQAGRINLEMSMVPPSSWN